MIVPLVSNITPPKSHVPTTNDPKQSLNPPTSNPPTLETKQVAKEKPVHNVCTNQKNQMNHGQPPKSVPTAQKLPTLPKTSDAKHSKNITKNPKKSETYNMSHIDLLKTYFLPSTWKHSSFRYSSATSLCEHTNDASGQNF